MKVSRQKALRVILLDVLLPIVILAAVITLIAVSIDLAGKSTLSENAQITEQGIRRAAAACYAAEGIYPDNIEYLIDNYGLNIDRERFEIFYRPTATNIMPDIRATAK